MPRYFFETRDGELVRDEVGLDLDGLEAVREEATRGLAELTKEAIGNSARRELAIRVRDESHREVLRAALSFEVAGIAG